MGGSGGGGLTAQLVDKTQNGQMANPILFQLYIVVGVRGRGR